MYYSNTVIKPEIKSQFSEIELIERKRLLGTVEIPDPDFPYKVRVASYLRVSTGLQAEQDKGSIPEQEEAAILTAKQNQWEFLRSFKDEKSTSFENDPNERKGLSEALEAAKQGLFDVLIVWSDSRLGRNSDEVRIIRKMFKSFGVQIYSVKKPLPITDPRFYNPRSDRFKSIYEGINDIVSESESAEFSARMEFGKKRVALSGRIPSRAPYGYTKFKEYVLDENGRQKSVSKTIPVEKELLVVSRIFKMYLRGDGFRKIVNSLNSEGIKGPKGDLWNYSTIRYTLKNPIYAGKVRWGWRLSQSKRSKERLSKGHTGLIVNGIHKQIVSEDDFIRVQKVIEKKAKLGGRAVGSKSLLAGILRCGRCGGRTYISHWHNWLAYQKNPEERTKHKKAGYYLCSNYAKYGKTVCSHRYVIAQKRVEEAVISKVKELAQSKTARDEFVKQFKASHKKEIKDEVKVLENSIEKLKQKKERSKIAYQEGITSVKEYGEDVRTIDKQLNDFVSRFNELRKNLEKEERIENQTKETLVALADFDKNWDRATIEEKKCLLQTILEKVVVKGNTIEIIFAH